MGLLHIVENSNPGRVFKCIENNLFYKVEGGYLKESHSLKGPWLRMLSIPSDLVFKASFTEIDPILYKDKKELLKETLKSLLFYVAEEFDIIKGCSITGYTVNDISCRTDFDGIVFDRVIERANKCLLISSSDISVEDILKDLLISLSKEFNILKGNFDTGYEIVDRRRYDLEVIVNNANRYLKI